MKYYRNEHFIAISLHAANATYALHHLQTSIFHTRQVANIYTA